MIYVVGIGPGSIASMTNEAIKAIEKSDIIVGYTVYVDLIKEAFLGKEYMTTPMKREIERCRLCLELSKKGKIVALICSGDAGVYGMASLILELREEYQDEEIEIIPGVTAANSGAAILGAPLNHDYALISLSDLLTPFELIEKRLRAAAYGDFAIALYNPSSKKRADYLKRACDILIDAGVNLDRPCGYVCNIKRKNSFFELCSLKELRDKEVDMFTTVFIGNSQSKILGDRLVTPRGYL